MIRTTTAIYLQPIQIFLKRMLELQQFVASNEIIYPLPPQVTENFLTIAKLLASSPSQIPNIGHSIFMIMTCYLYILSFF